jgi:hypothetical protein
MAISEAGDEDGHARLQGARSFAHAPRVRHSFWEKTETWCPAGVKPNPADSQVVLEILSPWCAEKSSAFFADMGA